MSDTPAARAPRASGRPARFPYATVVIVLIVVALSAGALVYFSSAKVEVIPNTVSAAVQSSFTASASSAVLPFQVLKVQKVASQSIAGSGTKTVHTYASGTITIYNTQAKAQRLITNTRFASPAGLIFRIRSAVTIPAGSSSKPGSIRATVYADQAGSTYNIGPTSFTVPGLSGTPQASEVYARSTDSMAGGASGTVPVVDATTEAQATKALVAALEPDLLASLKAQVPEGYVLIPGAATTTYRELASEPSTALGEVDVKEQGTALAVVFPNAALAGAIAAAVPGLGYQGEPLALATTTGLTLAAAGIPDSNIAPFTFTLAGTAPLVYTVDPSRIAAAVAGKSRSEAEVVLTNYPEVKRAVIILRPFWRQTFPQDPAAISVTTVGP